MKILVSKVHFHSTAASFPPTPPSSQTLIQCHQPVSNRISWLLISPHNTWLCELSFALHAALADAALADAQPRVQMPRVPMQRLPMLH